MTFNAAEVTVTWAHGKPGGIAAGVFSSVTHWSRVFEYPWALAQGRFSPKQWVLDAAGGDGAFQHAVAGLGCQVVNVDLDVPAQPRSAAGILSACGDLTNLIQFQDGVFDRVACLSVLEHGPQPEKILAELWRVLKPGGRLVLTFDVAHYARHNHTIDIEKATELFSLFKILRPTMPSNVLTMDFPELQDGFGGEDHVRLNVLCLAVTKRG